MTRLALFSTILLMLSAAPAAAADCYWSNGIYRCTDRSGRTYVVKPRIDPGERQQRRSQRTVRAPAYVPPPDTGSGMGGFSYGCTMMRC